MLAAKAWIDDIAPEIALGLLTLSGGNFRVFPILAPYTPGSNLVLSMLTLGTGTLGVKFRTVPPEAHIDPKTGGWIIWVPTRNGGWTWNYDGVNPAPPKTVYGFAVLDAGQTICIGTTDRLATPLLLNGPALFTLGEVSFPVAIPAIG